MIVRIDNPSSSSLDKEFKGMVMKIDRFSMSKGKKLYFGKVPENYLLDYPKDRQRLYAKSEFYVKEEDCTVICGDVVKF